MTRSSLLRRICGSGLLLGLILSSAITPAGAQRAHDSVTLTVWTPLGDPYSLSLLNPYFRQFEKLHPGITVKVADVAQDQNGGWSKYVTAMAAGRGPDVVLTTNFNPPVTTWAANGLIQPLDAYFKALGESPSKWLPWVWRMQYYHGHIWDFIQEYDTLFFVWNKDDFKKAGLNPNQPPRTIAQLDADAKKLTKFDKKGNLIQAGFVPWFNPHGEYEMRLWPTLFGGNVYDQAHGKYTINAPANVRALAWEGSYAKMLGGAEKVNGFTNKFAGNNEPIYSGQVAMQIIGDWVPIVNYKRYAPKNFHYGIAALPTAPGVPYGTNIVIGSDTFVMPAGTRHSREAAELMLYMMGTAPVLNWCDNEANMPPTRAAIFDPKFQQHLPYVSSAVKTARLALSNPRILNPLPSSSIYDYVTSQFTTAEQQVQFGRKSAKAALDDLQHLAEQREAQAKSSNPSWFQGGD